MTSTADNSTVIVTAFFDYQFNHIINAKGVDAAKENLSMLIDHVLLKLNFNNWPDYLKSSIMEFFNTDFESFILGQIRIHITNNKYTYIQGEDFKI